MKIIKKFQWKLIELVGNAKLAMTGRKDCVEENVQWNKEGFISNDEENQAGTFVLF